MSTKLKPEELRIGNFIKDHEEEIFIVDRISKDEVHAGALTAYAAAFEDEVVIGIPLSPEWLIRAGFKLEGLKSQMESSTLDWYTHLDFLYRVALNKVERINHGIGWHLKTGDNNWVRIEYIHQLQNLYFALTGTELNFKNV